jgi:signal transduction histidine kinase
MVVLVVVLISVLANLVLENQFRKYIIKNQENKNISIVNSISQQYAGFGVWKTDVIESIGINALENGMILKVTGVDGHTIWDAESYNMGLCQDMMTHMAKNMFSRYRNWQGGYVEAKYPVVVNNKTAGTVQIGYYGPFYFTDSDLAFINTLNRIIVGVGAASLLIAAVLGVVMAKRLSRPISRVIDTAQHISEGNYDERCSESSNIYEIDNLTLSINNLAESLEKQERLRKRLTGDVAHELRTPLATLQSHMEAMIDGIWEPDAKRLGSCHEEIMRISRLVGDLEELAKYEGENLLLTKTSFDISELVQNVLMNFEKNFMNKGIKVSFEGSENIINGDKDKITQVIVNLLSNAQKYTPEGGTVLTSIQRVGEYIEFRVKDNGMGISPEDLPNIFERFYRADKSRNRLTGGAGIGLTIVKAIVDAHKGTITVQSKPGEGTEFRVLLPVNA